MTLPASIARSTDPTVTTVVFEDAAAVAGVVVANVGVALHQLTGDHVWTRRAS